MTKESIQILQEIDCNCNDCMHMIRNMEKLPRKGTPCPINHGHCSKFAQPVSFIPSTCQIDTQNCFFHRKREVSLKSVEI